MVDNVCRYFADGLTRGEAIAAVATQAHCAAFAQGLRERGIDLNAAEAENRAVFLDAAATLASLLQDGVPDAALFDHVIGGVVRRIGDEGRLPTRAYGEMVGLLWLEKKTAEAIQLEELWNRYLERANLTLMCGYPIDVMGGDFRMDGIDAVLCAHTHLLPSGEESRFEAALRQALGDIFGSKVEGLDQLMRGDMRAACAQMPNPEAVILWLRRNLPDSVDDVMARARNYYAAPAELGAANQAA